MSAVEYLMKLKKYALSVIYGYLTYFIISIVFVSLKQCYFDSILLQFIVHKDSTFKANSKTELN